MKNLITLLFIFISVVSLQSRHIIGGTVEYTVNSVVGDLVNIDVTFHVYRDATTGGAQFDQSINIGVFGNAGSGFLYDHLVTGITEVSDVQNVDFGELIDCVPGSIDIQSAEYSLNLIFNLDEYDNFVIVYQRCCRANSLFNILDPEVTGIALSVELTREGIERIGSVKGFPSVFPVTISPSEEKTFDLSVNDGLTKRYALTHAKTAGGDDGVMEGDAESCTGITPDSQLCPPPFVGPFYRQGSGEYGLYDEVTVDSISGEFISSLSAQGSFLIAVKADSYENGALLSTTYQQFVQVVSMCDPNSVFEHEVLPQEIYPVPAHSMIYIGIPLTDVIVYDSKGTKLMSKPVFNTDHGIDVSALTVGVYFLEGFNEDSRKLIKRFVK
ncbi:MAG: hypothetical protein ACJA1A_001162 [Saprospiraceae bacterium]|jgi:hypothetical protein|tara:strand:- start:1689 stop:2840 length:1152 start_codon:yes stop_codon:yes gene_type:complete